MLEYAMRGFLKKLRRRRNLDLEIEAELAFHREMAEAAGDFRPLGNHLLIKESAADPWRFTFFENFWQDAAGGIRGLRRRPLSALTAIGALALGIGSATAVFSLGNAVLLKPAPVPHPDRLVVMERAATTPEFALWRGQTGVLEAVAAYFPTAMNVSRGDAAEQVEAVQISADALRCWGTPLVGGRGFSAEEDSPGGPKVALIAESLEQRLFAGDRRGAGETILLNGSAYTIIGVAANNLFLQEQGIEPEVYVPYQLDLNSRNPGIRFRMTARLKPGISLEQANARLRAAGEARRAELPQGAGDPAAARYNAGASRSSRPLLLILAGAVGLVLLIACVNVANLLLAQGESRRREIAIRASIGAGRGRVIRQLLTESLLLSMTGGALGAALGFAALRALLAVNTAGLPRLGPDGSAVGMDWRVMVFGLAISLVTGIAFGLWPAVAFSRADPNAVLKSGGHGSGAGIRGHKMRAVLAMAQAALAVVLLTGAALLIRTFIALYSAPTGLDTHDVVTMRMKITRPEFSQAAPLAAAIQGGLDRVRALPGVEAATATYFIPLQTAIASSFEIAGQPPVEQPVIGWVPAGTGYFEVFRIPVKRGRGFDARDDKESAPVVIINQSMARQYWPHSDPLQDRLLIGRDGPQFRNDPPRQIVGVVADVRDTQLSNPVRPTMYVPQAQIADAMNALLARVQPLAWMVRTRGDPLSLVPAIREQLREATGLPVAEVRLMNGVESNSVAKQRFNMLLMSGFAGAALLLAAMGIYGLMAHGVEQRRREIGIRLALGADPGRVRTAVVAEGMAIMLAGAALGLAAAFDLTRFLSSQLFGVQARDPLVFFSVPLLLGVVALVAIWIPARRASRVDPVQALRFD